MEYTQLGNTEIQISKLCVGCMSFGKARTMHDWTFAFFFAPCHILISYKNAVLK